MIIKEYAIWRYGPLSDSGIKVPDLFNLIYGSNEEGKTLTIDALLKMLFKKKLKVFKGIKRVEESPEGYLVMADNSNQAVKFPEAGTFDQYFGISPDVFANIFIIRDSDLSINEEDYFYRDYTSRLTGLRMGEIEKLKSEILDLGGITESGHYQNIAPVKLKDKINNAAALKKRAEELVNRLREEGFECFEMKLAEIHVIGHETAKKINLYREAQNREIYEKGAAALSRLESVKAEAENISGYNRYEYETWQKTVSELDYFYSEFKNLEGQIDEQKHVLLDLRRKLNEKRENVKKVEQDVKTAEKLEPSLVDYNQALQVLRSREALVKAPFYKWTLFVSALVVVLSLAGMIIRDTWWSMPVLLAAFLVTAALTGNKFHYLKQKGRLAARETKLYTEAEKVGLPAGDIGFLQKSIGSLQKDLVLKKEMQAELENELEWQLKEQERLRREQEDRKNKIKAAEDKITSIKNNSGLDNLDKYRDMLNLQQQLKTEAERQTGILGSHFGSAGSQASDQAHLTYWKDALSKLKIYADAAEQYSFDQAEYDRLLCRKEDLEQQEKELAEKMQDCSGKLRDLEKEANMLLFSEGEKSLTCQTTCDLEIILQKIDSWLQQQEGNRECALIVLEMLGSIEEEEEEKVAALFGAESSISEYFRIITADRYKEVVFRSGENRIKTIRSDGVELDAAQLSGGAYDQLYFSIRLALGEKLLEGDKGFFILDDPFIKADPVRLSQLLSMLEAIVAEGWQILYFSSKAEISEALQPKIASGEVRELKIN